MIVTVPCFYKRHNFIPPIFSKNIDFFEKLCIVYLWKA
jgi:hypothetical protein